MFTAARASIIPGGLPQVVEQRDDFEDIGEELPEESAQPLGGHDRAVAPYATSD